MVAPRRAGTLAWFNIAHRTITRLHGRPVCPPQPLDHSIRRLCCPANLGFPSVHSDSAPSTFSIVQHDPAPATRLPPRSSFLLQVQNHCRQAQHTPRNRTLSFSPTSLRDVRRRTAPVRRNLVDPFGLFATGSCNLCWIVVSVHHTNVSTARGLTRYRVCIVG